MFSSIRRSGNIYFLYFLQFLKSRMAYKWDFFGGMLASALTGASGVLFVIFLVDGKTIPDLNGWTRPEILVIYGLSLMSTALFSSVAINLYQFGDRYVIQGQFDRILLRPVNSLMQVLFESFNLDSLGNFALGLGLIAYATKELGRSLLLFDVIWLVVAAFSGASILISVFIAIATLSFYFEDRVGVAPPFFNLLMFSRYPLPIFNQVIQVLLSFVIPFGFAAYYPATHFFSEDKLSQLCYVSPLVALVCIFVASQCWKRGVVSYGSTGN